MLIPVVQYTILSPIFEPIFRTICVKHSSLFINFKSFLRPKIVLNNLKITSSKYYIYLFLFGLKKISNEKSLKIDEDTKKNILPKWFRKLPTRLLFSGIVKGRSTIVRN
ncbi:hypothetical protein PGB90_004529 [Kerria lacca]